MPTGDTGTMGGTIDASVRMIFDDSALPNAIGPDTIRVESDAAADTSDITIYGRDAGGVLISEDITMNGTVPVTGVNTYDRLLMARFEGNTHSGAVLVKLGNTPWTTISTMESGVNTVRRPFYNAIANEAGGADKDLYEKVCVRNNHATLTLTSASISGSAAGLSQVDIAVHTGLNDGTSVADRLTAPTGLSAFTDVNHSIDNLTAGSFQSVWLHLDLNAGESPLLDTYPITILGNTT
jgi:hypothetical protein